MSGQAAKQLTARQQCNKENFTFLVAHLVIHASHSQLGKLMTPVLQRDPEGEGEEGDDEDAISVSLPRPAPVTHMTGSPPGQEPVGLGAS